MKATNAFTFVCTLFILLTAFYIPYYNTSLYHDQFRQNGAYETLGKRNATQIHARLKTYLDTQYFNYHRPTLLQQFTRAEREHLADVKFLIDITCITYYILFAVLILAFTTQSIRSITKILQRSGITAVSITIVLSVMAILDFNTFWQYFHQVFFPQGNWRFPPTSLLLTLYPPSFFQAFITRFAMWTIGLGTATTVTATLLKRMR